MTDVGPSVPAVEELAESEGLSHLSPDRLAETLDVSRLTSSKRLGIFFWICVGWVVLNVLAVFFASDLHLQNPNNAYGSNFIYFGAPSLAHWFGTDDQGRDIFSRVVYGTRVSVVVGFGAAGIGLVLGGLIGMFSALVRLATGAIIGVAMFVMLAIPGLVSAIAILSFIAPTTVGKLIVVLGILATPLFYRVIWASTVATATRDYVTIARVQGASTFRIIIREILPNILPTALSYFIIGVAGVVVLEGTLSFLGLSVNPDATASWGNMIYESNGSYPQSIWLTVFPSLAMCLFLMALNVIQDRLQAYFAVTEVKL